MALKLTNRQARNYLVNYQGLGNPPELMGKDGVMEFFKRVGSIQYDPLDRAGRNAQLVLQARFPQFRKSMLNELLYTDRLLMDGWDKMMCIYPREDWPSFNKMRQLRTEIAGHILNYRDSNDSMNYLDHVMEELKRRGPLKSTQIDTPETGNSGGWGHNRHGGAALDYLFHRGDVGVFEKTGTQKVYTPMETLQSRNLLEAPDPFSSSKDFCFFLIKRRIKGVGMIWNRPSVLWQGIPGELNNSGMRREMFQELEERGEILPVEVEGQSLPFWITAAQLPDLDRLCQEEPEVKIRFLAPLDNFLWERDMTESLFGFKYRWEVYTPQKKREYGYYVLPILYKNRLIGRFEPIMDKKKGLLKVRRWWWEEEITPQLGELCLNALKDFAAFNGGCTRIRKIPLN